MTGATLAFRDRLSFAGVTRAREEQFQSHTLSTHQISGQFSQSTNDSEASKPHHRGSAHPALRKVRNTVQRTSLIQKREESLNISDTNEEQRAFVPPHSNENFSRPQMTTGSKQAMITLLRSFFFNFLFNRALHWSVQKLNSVL